LGRLVGADLRRWAAAVLVDCDRVDFLAGRSVLGPVMGRREGPAPGVEKAKRWSLSALPGAADARACLRALGFGLALASVPGPLLGELSIDGVRLRARASELFSGD
jgi:hypothetical protein